MSKDPKYHTVAKGVRLEIDDSTNEVFIVFKVINPLFAQRVRENWADDIELVMHDKSLVIKDS